MFADGMNQKQLNWLPIVLARDGPANLQYSLTGLLCLAPWSDLKKTVLDSKACLILSNYMADLIKRYLPRKPLPLTSGRVFVTGQWTGTGTSKLLKQQTAILSCWSHLRFLHNSSVLWWVSCGREKGRIRTSVVTGEAELGISNLQRKCGLAHRVGDQIHFGSLSKSLRTWFSKSSAPSSCQHLASSASAKSLAFGPLKQKNKTKKNVPEHWAPTTPTAFKTPTIHYFSDLDPLPT